MKKNISLFFALLIVSAHLLLTGCATNKQAATLYDLGPLRPDTSNARLPALPPISIADVQAPASLDSTTLFFRLDYANDQQPRPYAHNRWSMPPAQLLTQRLKSRIAQAGGTPLPASDGAAGVPVLRIEADDFMQIFTAPGQSTAQASMRAALFQGRTLIAQKTFIRQAPAPSADAAGGVRALAAASDAIITEMMAWLAALPLTSR